jgi:hypothetical protein
LLVLTGSAAYNLDAILVGRLEQGGKRVRMTDLLYLMVQRIANADQFQRHEIAVVNFAEPRGLSLPSRGPTLSQEVVPNLQVFPIAAVSSHQ